MAEYIEREATYKRIVNNKKWAKCPGTMEYAAELVKSATTADVVEVVRCKDCKHFIQEEHGCNHFGYYSHTPWVDEVDFCSYGERREGELPCRQADCKDGTT